MLWKSAVVRHDSREMFFFPLVCPVCSSNPCQNDGSCRLITETGKEVCNCRGGYSGPRCSLGEWGARLCSESQQISSSCVFLFACSCTCACAIMVWCPLAGEDMSGLHSSDVSVAVSSCSQLCLLTCPDRFKRKGGRRSVFSSKPIRKLLRLHWMLSRNPDTFPFCMCRAWGGVLQQQGHQLPRGGGHHGVRCSVPALGLRPAVWWVSRWHSQRLAAPGPWRTRFLQVCSDSSCNSQPLLAAGNRPFAAAFHFLPCAFEK